MKRIFIISLLGSLTFCPMMAQQTDPTLTGAVIAQSGMLKKIFKDREKTQKKSINCAKKIQKKSTRQRT